MNIRSIILLLLILLIIVIISNNNKFENLDVSKNKFEKLDVSNNKIQFPIKSIEAVNNLASMYNNKMLLSTSANIDNINTNKLCLKNNSCIDDTTINKLNNLINNDNIQANKLCFKNNLCIDDNMMNKLNNVINDDNRNKNIINKLYTFIPNELIYYKNEIRYIYGSSLRNYIKTYPTNNRQNNNVYPIQIDEVYNMFYGNEGYTLEITIPLPPKNTNYDYSVLWLNIHKYNYNNIEINVDGVIYAYNISSEYTENLTYYYNNLLEYKNDFIWMPYVINGFNNNRKIYINIIGYKNINYSFENNTLIETKNIINKKLYLNGIAFSTNPLNLVISNINVQNKMYAYDLSEFSFYDPNISQNYQDIEKIIINAITASEKYLNNKNNNNIVLLPYKYSMNDKMLWIESFNLVNCNINVYLGVNNIYTYLSALENFNILSYPLNKLLNKNYYGIRIPRNLLNSSSKFISIKFVHTCGNIIYPRDFEVQLNQSNWSLINSIKLNYLLSYDIKNIGIYDIIE